MKLPALGSLALLVLHRPRFSSIGRPQGISWWCSLLSSSTLLLVQCRIHTAIQHQSIFSLQSTVVLGNLQLNKCESALKGLTNLSYSGNAHVSTLNGAQPLPSGPIRGQKRTDSQQQCPMGSTFLSMPNNPWYGRWTPPVALPMPVYSESMILLLL